jgi:UDP-N-acetylglucosamine 2-epimerase (non-hydrolysing)
MDKKKIKVMTVFGTRPEAIKMAPIVLELQKHPDTITPVVAVTAQHREMLDQVLSLFHIVPDHDLDIMAQGQTLFDITSKAMLGLDKVLTEEKPDIVLVHGDTTTTFAGALAAYYHQTTVGHVEAGLRTHNKYSPFPGRDEPQAYWLHCGTGFCPDRDIGAQSVGRIRAGRADFRHG